MNNRFDELTRGLAQSVTRRGALRKFGTGLAGMALACFGLARSAEAGKPGCKPGGHKCENWWECCGWRCDKSDPKHHYGICL